MKRIMSDRGLGKTTSLLNYAKSLAKQNADYTIFFVCVNPTELQRRYQNDIPSNLKFLGISDLLNGSLRGRQCKIVVDEVEALLQQLKIDAYTLTLSDTNW